MELATRVVVVDPRTFLSESVLSPYCVAELWLDADEEDRDMLLNLLRKRLRRQRFREEYLVVVEHALQHVWSGRPWIVRETQALNGLLPPTWFFAHHARHATEDEKTSIDLDVIGGRMHPCVVDIPVWATPKEEEHMMRYQLAASSMDCDQVRVRQLGMSWDRCIQFSVRGVSDPWAQLRYCLSVVLCDVADVERAMEKMRHLRSLAPKQAFLDMKINNIEIGVEW